MKKRRADRLYAACDGETVVEFALVASVFLMLMFGCVEFARLLWTEMALQQTAISGARCMSLAQGSIESSACASGGNYSSSSTTSYIQTTASGWGLTLANSDISLNNAATCGGVSSSSQVTLNTTFTTPVPQLVQLAAGGTALQATACYPNNGY